MPIYEYTCQDCGQPFERLVRLGAAAPACPACQGELVVRRLSAPVPLTGGMREPVAAGCGRCGDPGGSCPYRPN